MSDIPMRSECAVETLDAGAFDMKLEIVVIPVSDVDRAKRFYGELGWRLEVGDTRFTDEVVKAIHATTAG
ncbi:hypothetical protein [Paraburkholderia sediminicola]|uniref:hypothetical protein n=1 Tax=Paraburkholderia sediminicola TaxID=458836 RepID=UPI0038B9DA55